MNIYIYALAQNLTVKTQETGPFGLLLNRAWLASVDLSDFAREDNRTVNQEAKTKAGPAVHFYDHTAKASNSAF